MNVPSVSVVVPAFNAERTIRRAIDSVLEQTCPADEIIVVDDGSEDSSAAVVEEYGAAVKLLRQPNAKTAASRNRAIDHARGDWIGFLDADDYWEPRKLERQRTVIQQHPEVGVVASRYYFQQPSGARQVNRWRSEHWLDQVISPRGAAAFRLGTMLWTGTVLVRRTALQSERFVSGLEPAEDRDLWVRLVSEHPTYLLSDTLATAVLEPGGISRTSIARDCTKMLEVIERHQEKLDIASRLAWRSYVHYRWAAMEPSWDTALALLMKSYVGWPAPFIGLPSPQSWGRSRRLAFLLREAVRSSPAGRMVS